jgi:hypothetical protein
MAKRRNKRGQPENQPEERQLPSSWRTGGEGRRVGPSLSKWAEMGKKRQAKTMQAMKDLYGPAEVPKVEDGQEGPKIDDSEPKEKRATLIRPDGKSPNGIHPPSGKRDLRVHIDAEDGKVTFRGDYAIP